MAEVQQLTLTATSAEAQARVAHAKRLLTSGRSLQPRVVAFLRSVVDSGGDAAIGVKLFRASGGQGDRPAPTAPAAAAAGAAAPASAVASQKKRPVKDVDSDTDGVRALKTAVKKSRPPARPVTPDTVAADARPGAPAAEPLVPPQVSGSQGEKPPAAPVEATLRTADASLPAEPQTAGLPAAHGASTGAPAPAALAEEAPTEEVCPAEVAALFPRRGDRVETAWIKGATLEAEEEDIDKCVVEAIGAPTLSRKRALGEETGRWFAYASVSKTRGSR